MPELPEVETTVRGLKKKVVGLSIKDVWTDLETRDKRKRGTAADPRYFKNFRSSVVGEKIISAERRAKNILINLSGGKTILMHLKMTGHLLYGKYKKENGKWKPDKDGTPLSDPFNRFIHLVFSLSNRKHLVLSDTRKFGKIVLLDTKTAFQSVHLNGIGPEPLEKNFMLKSFSERILKKPNGKIKTVLMDQSVIAGIGNIYSDEILWLAGVHPERKTSNLSSKDMREIFKAVKATLSKGIDFGGDSTSDYRNIDGLPGKFQLHHNVYQKKGEKCRKAGCRGIISRKIVNGRSAHFCPSHQK